MKYLFLLFIPILCLAETKRLDPHGLKTLDYKTFKSLKDMNQCTVCHQDKGGKITVKAGLTDVCLSCHNKAPHSGAADHLGKVHQGTKISCVSCHTPHRSENAMVKKTCTECHQWP